jgi:ATP adenylyltransferase
MTLYCLANVRTAEQRARMVALEEAGVCLFCPDGLAAYGSSLFENESWLVVDNDFPYAGTRRHLLLIPRAHVRDLLELDPVAREQFWEVLDAARTVSEASYYGLGVRNGECAATGGTIAHLHLHLLVPDPEATDRSLRMRFNGRSALGT